LAPTNKRRTRLEAIRSALYALDDDGKTEAVVAKPAPRLSVRVPIFSTGEARPAVVARRAHLAADVGSCSMAL
jgi:hypothetical protein